MVHHSLKRKIIISFLLMLCCAVNNPCTANSTLAVPFPETDYGHTQDSGDIVQYSGYGSGSDYHDHLKKPFPDQGRFQGLQNTIWLVPVLRYLITVSGNSVQMETNPIISLLPVVLQTAASWWFHADQVLELADRSGEVIVGDPYLFDTFPNDMDGNSNSKKQNDEASASDSNTDEKNYPMKIKTVLNQITLMRKTKINLMTTTKRQKASYPRAAKREKV